MVSFGRGLQTWQQGQKPQEMETLSLNVAHAARKELETQQREADTLKNRYNVFLRFSR
jgi:hypothetical protein